MKAEKKKNALLILLRHGESCWNRDNIFTGWVDVPLSSKGIQEALEAGKYLADVSIDLIFTSTLVRAQMTTFLAMSQNHSPKIPMVVHPAAEKKMHDWSEICLPEARANSIPVIYSWELNERMYGELQGCNKAEMAKRHSAEQIKIWRRSYNVAPPEGESLEMTANRVIPYFIKHVIPALNDSKTVLISAHGNSLRAICMVLDKLSQEEVLELEIPTGKPILYDYRSGTFSKHYAKDLSR